MYIVLPKVLEDIVALCLLGYLPDFRSTWAGNEAGEGVLSVGREVERVVRIEPERSEVRFLEVYEEPGYEDTCEAVL